MRNRAYLLGIAGVVPFWALALLVWWLPFSGAMWALTALSFYAAVIVSFLGAVHWGVLLATEPAERALIPSGEKSRLFWGVVPAILAFLILLIPPPEVRLSLLFIVLIATWWLDRRLLAGLPSDWSYLRLRAVLTVLAALAILAALGGLVYTLG